MQTLSLLLRFFYNINDGKSCFFCWFFCCFRCPFDMHVLRASVNPCEPAYILKDLEKSILHVRANRRTYGTWRLTSFCFSSTYSLKKRTLNMSVMVGVIPTVKNCSVVIDLEFHWKTNFWYISGFSNLPAHSMSKSESQHSVQTWKSDLRC